MSASKEPKKEQQEKDINKINTKDKNGINDPILKDTFKRQVFFFKVTKRVCCSEIQREGLTVYGHKNRNLLQKEQQFNIC